MITDNGDACLFCLGIKDTCDCLLYVCHLLLQAGIINSRCGIRDPGPMECPDLVTGACRIILGTNNHAALVQALTAQTLFPAVKECDLFSMFGKAHRCNPSCRTSADDCDHRRFSPFCL